MKKTIFLLSIIFLCSSVLAQESEQIKLSIRTDKREYSTLEEIFLNVTFNNTDTQTERMLLYDKPSPKYTVFSYYTLVFFDGISKKTLRFPLKEVYSNTELPWHGQYLKPGERTSFDIPIKEKLMRLHPKFDLTSDIKNIALEYQTPGDIMGLDYWSGKLTSNKIPIKIKEAAVKFITKDKAVKIARGAVKDVDIPRGTPIKVELLRSGIYVVTFVYQLPEGKIYPAPDYHAQIHIDAQSGAVLKFLVGS